MRDFVGTVVLVTGASSGIGRASARALAEVGSTLALVARSKDQLQSLVDTLPGTSHSVLAADLTDSIAVEQVVSDTVSKFGRIDVLLANAGRYVPGEVAGGDVNEWDDMLAINVNSTFRLVREVLPHMIAQRSGDIVITSSISGYRTFAEEPVYSASKHAVTAFAHALRGQVAGKGIRVGAVAPGTVLNRIWGYADERQIEEAVRRHEGLRSEDVAEAILFMLSRPPHVSIRDLVILPQGEDV